MIYQLTPFILHLRPAGLEVGVFWRTLDKHWKDFLDTNRYICSGQEAIEYFENNYAKAWANADGIFCIQKI